MNLEERIDETLKDWYEELVYTLRMPRHPGLTLDPSYSSQSATIARIEDKIDCVLRELRGR